MRSVTTRQDSRSPPCLVYLSKALKSKRGRISNLDLTYRILGWKNMEV